MSVSILVVDDEPDVAELFRQRFRRETRQGTYVMHFATSGAEALDRLAGEIEARVVAGLTGTHSTGAYGDDERRQRAAEHGAADFLAKPVDFEHLKAQLRQLPGVPD